MIRHPLSPDPSDRPDPIGDPDRLAGIAATGVLDDTVDETFHRATRIASSALGAPVALVSIVTDDRQVFVGQHGLEAPAHLQHETPLSHSFCQHVVVDGVPLAIPDARLDDRVCGNLAIEDLGVVAYLGVPIHSTSGHVLGSFCVIDTAPRTWSEDDLALLRELAVGVERALQVRVALDEARVQRQRLDNVMDTLLHEIRDPMHGILEGLELLLVDPGDVDEETRERTGLATGLEARRILGMVESLAQRHRGAAPTLAEAAEVVQDVVDARRLGRHRGRVTLDREIRVTRRVAVPGDSFASLVANLVDNALRHTTGPVRVRVDVSESGVDLEVADEGPGFVVDEVQLAPVGRAGDLPRGAEGDLALGLRIVRRRTDELGGAIRFDSAPDRGTTVSVWVPPASEG